MRRLHVFASTVWAGMTITSMRRNNERLGVSGRREEGRGLVCL